MGIKKRQLVLSQRLAEVPWRAPRHCPFSNYRPPDIFWLGQTYMKTYRIAVIVLLFGLVGLQAQDVVAPSQPNQSDQSISSTAPSTSMSPASGALRPSAWRVIERGPNHR